MSQESFILFLFSKKQMRPFFSLKNNEAPFIVNFKNKNVYFDFDMNKINETIFYISLKTRQMRGI